MDDFYCMGIIWNVYNKRVGETYMKQWDNLWEKGQPTTFAKSFPDGYTEGFVYDWLIGLSLDDSILEVGCGNVSLVPFLLDNQIGKTYTGVDSANCFSPYRAVDLDILLHKEKRMEDTSFVNQFNHVVSIYGIEYTNVEQTLPLIYNSLKQDGEIHFMMHNINSPITRYAERQINKHYSMDFKSTGNLIEDFKAEKVRHKEQIETARDKTQIEVFKCLLKDTGFIDIEIVEQERKLAWLIGAKR